MQTYGRIKCWCLFRRSSTIHDHFAPQVVWIQRRRWWQALRWASTTRFSKGERNNKHSLLKLTVYRKVKNVHNVNTEPFKKHCLYILAILLKFSNIYLPIIIGKKGALPLFFSSSEIMDSNAKQIRWPYFKRRMLSSLL